MMHTAPAIPRLGVPEYSWWSEALHGVGRLGRSGHRLSAGDRQWRRPSIPEAVEKLGDIIATEAGHLQRRPPPGPGGPDVSRPDGLDPTINIFRDPRWGRGQETYGEDPYLTTQMGLAMVRGLQGHDPRYLKLSACAKHLPSTADPRASGTASMSGRVPTTSGTPICPPSGNWWSTAG